MTVARLTRGGQGGRLGVQTLALVAVLSLLPLIGPATGSSPILSVAAAAVAPVAPSDVEATWGDRVAALKWEHAPAADRGGYHVFRSTTLPVSTSGSPINGSLVTGQTYIDTGRTNGTTYHYVVVSQDTTGARSAASATVSARPAAPAVPSGATISWLQKAASEIARAEAGGAAVDGKLYVFGGQFSGVTQTLRSDRYDPATDSWTRIRDLPELVTHAAVVPDGSTLWLIGGYVGETKKDSTRQVWKYDTLTDTYTAGPALPAPRGGGGAAMVGRELHYFSGAVRMDSTGAPTTDHPEHWALDVDFGTSWAASTPVPNPRNHVAAAALNGKIYLIGGQHGEFEAATPQAQVDVFDIATKAWTRLADLPVPRGHISASTFVLEGKLLVLGGSVVGAKPSPTIYQYDPATNAWTTRTNLGEAVRSPVSDLIGGKLVVSGGRSSSGPSVKTWSGSVEGSSTPTDTTAPAAPSGVTAAAGSGPSVAVRWTASSESDLAGYAVYRSTSSTVSTSGTPVSGSALLSSPSFTDTAVSAGTTYSYVVVAKDSSGNTSAASSTATATVPSSSTGDGVGSWSTSTPLPSSILDAGGAAIGSKIYVVDGKTSTGPKALLRIFDTVSKSWTTGPALPGSAVENPAVTVWNGQLYAMGGSTGAFSGAVASAHRYDPVANAWTALASMPSARGGAAAVAVHGSIWVLGGMSGDGASLASTVRYDIAAGTWSAGPSLATARDNPGAGVVAGKIYVFGGRTRLASGTEAAPRLTSTEFLDPASTTAGWQSRAAMPTGRRTMAVGVISDRIIASGGEKQPDGSTFPQTEEYDPATNTWRSLLAMPTPRHGAAAAVVDGKLHTIGGGPKGGSSYSTAHEVFTPGTGSSTPTDTTAPAAPSGVTAAAGSGPSVAVRWTASSESDLAGYAVYRSTSSTVSTSGTPVSGSALLSSPSFTDTAVSAGTTYSYVVVAKDSSGNTSAASSTATATVPSSSTGDGVGSWSTSTPLPSSILDAGGAAIGSKIYVVDGKTSTGPKALLRIFDTVSKSWTTGPALPGSAVENPAVTVWNGQLYAMGGSTGAFSGAVASAHRYDPVANAWTALASMPSARGGAAAVAVHGSIWVLGGMSGDGASLASTVRYDIAAGTWSAGPSLATARDNPGAGVVAGKIYVFGGRTRLASGTEAAPRLTSTEFLDPASTTAGWQSRAAMPTGRRTMAVGVISDRIIASGGEKQPDGSTFPQTEEYDPATNTWRSLLAMPTPRHGAAAAVVDGKLHTIGGGPKGGSSYSTAHEVFTPGTGSSTPTDTTAPAAPSGVTAAAGSGPSVAVRWTASSESDLAGYAVYRSTSSTVSTSGTPVSGSALLSSPSFTDTAVSAGTTYSYVVVAKDSSGNTSAASSTATVTVPSSSTGDGLDVRVNFSDAVTEPPTGYLRDHGQSYAVRTGASQGGGIHSYGWVQVGTATPLDLTRNGRARTGTAETDVRRSTLMHMQYVGSSSGGTATPGSWELAVPDGSYAVTVAVGDAGAYYNSSHTVNVEGQNAIALFTANTESSQEFRVREAPTRVVHVRDGRLTLSPVGGTNTKLDYVVVQELAQQGSPRLASVTPANAITGVLDDASVTAELSLTAGGGIDADTLSGSNVTLTRVVDGFRLAANVNTSGGGDVIVLTPTGSLTAGVMYRFTVTSGVKDVAGAAFEPWSSVFTVGTSSAGTGIEGVAFDKFTTPGTGEYFTSVVIGPDGKLYAGTLRGAILRYPVLGDGDLGPVERIDSLVTAQGSRTVVGLAFDPASTATDLRLYVTSSLPYLGVDDVADFSGRIVLLSGADLQTVQDVVVGLPRSVRDHVTNSLAFGPDGALYVSQGGNTAMGAPDSAWGNRPERLLSAAVLRLDLAALPSTLPLDVVTRDGGGSYDPFTSGAPLTLHASGVRNAYDLVWHRNGNLYVPTNGSAAGGNVPGTPAVLPASCSSRLDGAWTGPAVPGITANPQAETDYVFNVHRGGYYGHPTPVRCEWAYNGGNPTQFGDPYEATAYPAGTKPDRNYRLADVFDIGLHASANGVVEYTSTAFGGKLAGKLLVVRYSAGQDVVVLDPSGPGGKILSRTSGVTGLGGFKQPLDITEDPITGTLYVTELGAQRITRLKPRV